MTITEYLFEGDYARAELEERLEGVPYSGLRWDSYDCSLELDGVPTAYRLPSEAQQIIHEAGFGKVYVNHVDGWETHYTFVPGDFQAVEGWRVSYPAKRGEGGPILVEKRVETWPPEWFDTGYAVVQEPKP